MDIVSTYDTYERNNELDNENGSSVRRVASASAEEDTATYHNGIDEIVEDFLGQTV